MLKTVPVVRHPQGQSVDDTVAQEEPIEIRVNGESIAVLMRTPGDDENLVAGFALTEGIVDGPDDIRALGPCTDPSRPNADNVYSLALEAGCNIDDSRLAKARRQFYATSSCGICGKATIENIHQAFEPHAKFVPLDHAIVLNMGDEAMAQQEVFSKTGGLHAAAVFDQKTGELITVAEDIGRHNAVDKVVGRMLLQDRIPLHDHALWVSGRASFEVVQKALVAGITALVCVGAPSSLAVEMAVTSHMTLLGFARGNGRFNVYAGAVVNAPPGTKGLRQNR